MGSAAPVTQLPVSATALQAVDTSTDFDIRWNAWVARGLAHDQRVRRRLLIWGPLIAIAAGIAFALFSA